jgi:hypothetical protein
MTMRPGNNPKRRIAAETRLDLDGRKKLAGELSYVGSALHKRRPGDYGFVPPANPRPAKSLCDGLRPILKGEATDLFVTGIGKGLFSDFPEGDIPKYVWSVDPDGQAYEAKIVQDGYHGYRLEDEDDMRTLVLQEWARR